ncbi:phosphotransferase [Noviherbaspirillum aridicola]|uniref:Aminoglycoside phosphotransferase n=1 Tax=Noviherbaspirillum aridicola TaxID=2849687 RepID=A0ABQ4Q3N1_9BURK|nr:phosphotransferase [Noviherbaspirillum aridicola]GIZ51455.1 aminoglycoside phosphotransferase [Noviherbaspirillum aridicola]
MSQSYQDRFVGTRPVAPAHAFDVDRLAAWMRGHVEGYSGDLSVEQFKGGQSNPTFLLSAGGKQYVMRRKPPGTLLPSAHAVDREYRVITALANTDVPVARTYALCEDESVIGTMFYIMDYVQGRILWDPALPGMTPQQRREIFDEMNRVIAALHSVDYAAVGLESYGKAGSYIERQVARWTKQYRASETEHIEAVENLIEWLPKNIPADDETRVVHGDFRIDNVIFHPTEPRVLAVLDWELSTLGHPLSDFAYHCMTWRMPPEQSRGLAGMPLAELGLPTEAEYVAEYCRRTGRGEISQTNWEYYMVFNMFRLVGILQGIAKRVQLGNAASAEAANTARRTRPLAEQAWRLVEQMQKQ